MKVLEIGSGKSPKAKLVPSFKNAEVVTMDIDENNDAADIHHDASSIPDELHGQFDAVFASHVLEHFSYWNSVNILREWAKAVKPGGEIHVVVPSLEWCAEQILSEKPSRGVMGMLYGEQDVIYNVHLAGFTMRLLRRCCEEAGLKVVRARSGEYHINVAGEIMPTEQHYVCGVKEG